ncbi:MAG: SUMF1/EgtB/PvdO family nonheme iron enzyme [Polyangia bacterium]
MSASRSRVLGLMVVSAWLAAGCSSAKKIDVGGTCILNSDCTGSLVCTSGVCHVACRASTDCPAGQSCMKTSDSAVCVLPAEVTCSATSSCKNSLLCAPDQHCRTACATAANCTTNQVCASNFCADPNDPDLVNGQIPPTAAPDAGTYDALSPDLPAVSATDAPPATGPEAGVTYDASLDAPAGPDAPAALLDAEPDIAPDASPPAAQDAPGTGSAGCPAACTGNTPVCSNGNCVACSPGDITGCVSNAPATCSTTGAWVANALACVNQTCLNGSCQGECAPGQALCVSSAQAATCSSTGTLQKLTDCGSGQCINGTCEPSPPSCPASDAGISGCGPSNESCCTSLELPGGTYYRTYTYGADGGTGQADPATVSGFRLDKYLVTVGRFRQFVTAWNGGWRPSAGSGIHTHLNVGKGLASAGYPGAYETGWNPILWNSNVAPTDANLSSCGNDYSISTWTNAAGSQENLPISCVNWYEAYAFCIWDGGFLPSEAEWEYAAAGGSEQREYPWGAADPGSGCQYAVFNNCYSGIAPVGAAMGGIGRWGQLDLAGNVEEWNQDGYGAYANPCADCAQLTVINSNSRILRGGAWAENASTLLPPSRYQDAPTGRGAGVYVGGYGLRCARIP